MTQCSAASLLKTKRHKRQTGNNLAKKNQLDYSLWVGCFIAVCVSSSQQSSRHHGHHHHHHHSLCCCLFDLMMIIGGGSRVGRERELGEQSSALHRYLYVDLIVVPPPYLLSSLVSCILCLTLRAKLTSSTTRVFPSLESSHLWTDTQDPQDKLLYCPYLLAYAILPTNATLAVAASYIIILLAGARRAAIATHPPFSPVEAEASIIPRVQLYCWRPEARGGIVIKVRTAVSVVKA